MPVSASRQPAPGKSCGSCMMCCKVPHITEFKKPPGVWCAHAVTGKGCRIYANRPDLCRAFYCGWMYEPGLGPEWKPDKAKFVVMPARGPFLHITVDPGYPDSWTRPPYLAEIKRWATDRIAREQFVLVRIGSRLIVVLPDREVRLGEVDPEAPIIVSREHGPAGTIYDFKAGDIVEPSSQATAFT
jgi:hypothetical protein